MNAEQLKKLDDGLETLQKNVHIIQERQESLGEEMKGHEGMKEAIEDTTKAVEAINTARQEEKAELVAMQNTVKEMEARLARGVKGAANDSDLFPEYGNEFNRYLKKGIEPSPELLKDVCQNIVETTFKGAEAEEIQQEVKTMVVGSNPRGGYFVRPEVSNRMIERIFETSPLRAVANVVTIASDRLDIIIDDNEAADGGWVGEVQARPETDTPEIGELTILAHELYAQPKVTQKFLDDAGIDVESWLQGKVTRKMSRSENTAFILGDGSKKPKGLLAYPDADTFNVYQRGAISTRDSNVAGSFDGNDLKLLQNGLKEEYQPGAIWGMNRSTFGTVITLQDDQGQYIMDTRFLRDRDEQVLLSKPVVFMNDMPTEAEDALCMVYGDFDAGYTIVDRTGFRVIRDEVTEKPFIKFYTTKRTGGDVTSYDSWNRLRCAVTP